MTSETLNVILIILVVLVGAFGVYQKVKRGETVTAGTVVNTIKAAQPLAQELINVATIAVNSAEQLKNTGKIGSNDEAFDYALNFVKKWIPAASGIDNADIKAAIEGAVLVANFMSEQISSKVTPSDTTPPAHPIIDRTGLR